MATTITANGINFPDGSAGTPSIGGSDTNTGLFTGSDVIGFATGGNERLRIDAIGNVNILNDSGKFQLGASNDFQFFHDGSSSRIYNSTGDLVLRSASYYLNSADGSENIIKGLENGAVELYFNNSKKFHTYTEGCSVFGNLNLEDNDRLRFGDSSDLQIYHDGTHSYINDIGTGQLRLKTNQLTVLSTSEALMMKAVQNGQVELYHNGSKKFETTSAGVSVTGTIELTGSLGLGTHTGMPNTRVDIGLGVFAATGDDEAADWGANNVFQLTATGGNAANNQILLVGAHSGGVGQIASGIGFGRDSTTNWGTYLSFKTHSTATSNIDELKERMRIGSNGAINAQGVYDQTTSSSANVNVASDGHIRRSTSSRRYKNTITDATHGLTELLKLKSVTFKGNEDGDTVFGGLIAEDVHNAGLTEFVHYDKDNEPDALAYGNMVALCVKAIQDLNAKVKALEAA